MKEELNVKKDDNISHEIIILKITIKLNLALSNSQRVNKELSLSLSLSVANTLNENLTFLSK
jgi:hypothetical protein